MKLLIRFISQNTSPPIPKLLIINIIQSISFYPIEKEKDWFTWNPTGKNNMHPSIGALRGFWGWESPHKEGGLVSPYITVRSSLHPKSRASGAKMWPRSPAPYITPNIFQNYCFVTLYLLHTNIKMYRKNDSRHFQIHIRSLIPHKSNGSSPQFSFIFT